jgi:hypothetical protein
MSKRYPIGTKIIISEDLQIGYCCNTRHFETIEPVICNTKLYNGKEAYIIGYTGYRCAFKNQGIDGWVFDGYKIDLCPNKRWVESMFSEYILPNDLEEHKMYIDNQIHKYNGTWKNDIPTSYCGW